MKKLCFVTWLIEGAAEQALEEAKMTEEEAKGLVNAFPEIGNQLLEKKESLKSASVTDSSTNTADPDKGKWGGLAINKERKITATVTNSKFLPNFFNIHLEVVSTNPERPLMGEVIFHIHPTFPNPERIVKAENGIAQLDLLSYGSFTVGVECDNKNTQLELDLAELPNVSKIFKES